MNIHNPESTTFLEGFYSPEHDGIRSFRWMRRASVVRLDHNTGEQGLYVTVGNPEKSPAVLNLRAGKTYTYTIPPGWNTLAIPLEDLAPASDGIICLFSDNTHTAPNDSRELSLMIGEVRLEKESPQRERIQWTAGFYGEEGDELRAFRWMQQYATLTVAPAKGEWLLFEVGYPGSFPVQLTIRSKNKESVFSIINGWQQLAIDLSDVDEESCTVIMKTDAIISAENDTRILALMIGSARLSPIPEYEHNSFYLHSDLFKKTKTKARPTFLTFETSAVCNMQCTMCVVATELKRYDITRIKSSDKTDYLYDELLSYASKIQLHATGEVLTGKDFWKALNKATSVSGQRPLEIEIFTNGQLLSQSNIDKIIASPLTDIVISTDAATAKTYGRIRGGDFEHLCTNIRNLVRKNREHGKLRIAMSMVLMRENIEELPEFIELAHTLGVKTVTFWPLFAVGMDMPLKTATDGFRFHYRQQMLINYPNITTQMIAKATDKANALSIRIGVTPCFSKDYRQIKYEDLPYPLPYDEFCTLAEAPERTLMTQAQVDDTSFRGCYLPWNTAFITTEGRFSPCLLMTYLGGIDSVIGKDFFTEVWNGKIMQELRQSIIDGKPHHLCQDAQCIFVNKLY